MNILHLDDQLGWRGGEQQASWLVQGLVAKGHKVWISGKADGEFLKSTHGGAPLVRLPLPYWAEVDLYTCWRLAQVVYQEEIDIIHAHTSHTHTIACITRAMARRGAAVVSRRVSFPPKTDRFNQWKYRAPDALAFVGADAPGWITDVMSEQSLRDAGVFDPVAGVKLWEKCSARGDSHQFSNADNMALVGVLSTQLVWQRVLGAGAPAPLGMAVRTVIDHRGRHYR